MPRKPQKSESRSTVLLRIELLNIEPLIWRRVRVPVKWTLAEVLRTDAQEFLYVYDFGDAWEHLLIVEPAAGTEAGSQLAPMCLAGENAAPPEDVGGPPGYELFLEALGDPQHERHEEMLEWVGGTWDPRAFDINSVNRSLKARK